MDRRHFLTVLVSTAAAAGLGRSGAGYAHDVAVIKAKLGAGEKAYIFFTEPEIRFIEAAIARIIPADDLGPGALESDVAIFLDNQLAGAYGNGARTYMQGPWGESTPFQGYQLPIPPAGVYRVGIAATDRYCQETYDKVFADLEAETQDQVLAGLQGVAEAIELKDIPATSFFRLLARDTKDGFFSDPVYGGNRDKAGWKLVGYPGAPADFTDQMFLMNEPYVVEPVSIREVQEASVPLDQYGHATHRVAKAEDIPATSAPVLRDGKDRVRVAAIDPLVQGEPIA
jgi:gluconate 2-dehydrogenase gamma chain